MTLRPSERDVVASLCPFPIRGVAEEDLGDILDAWFAADHYDDNPVYIWNDNESTTHDLA